MNKLRFSRTTRAFLSRLSGLLILCVLLLSACTLPNLKAANGPTQDGLDTSIPTATQEQALDEPLDSAGPESEVSTSTVAPSKVTELLSADISGANDVQLNDLIVFTSLSFDPFTNIDLGEAVLDKPERHLWAISPDEQRAGRLSPAGQGTALYLPGSEQELVKFIANGLALNHPVLEPVAMPEECAQGGGSACSGYSFGPEGRTLAYYTGVGECGRSLSLVDLVFNQTINTWSNVQWYEFLLDGSLVLSLDDCSGDPRNIYLYIPNKNTQAGLGQEGNMLWNPSHQAALVEVTSQLPAFSGLWGLNLQTSRVFLWMEQEQRVIDDSPIWLPDGRHFLYQHRPIQYYANSITAVLEGPRQIILMDAWSRDQRLLAFDERYDYHLHATTGSPYELRADEWIKIRRTPFKTLRVSLEETDLPEVRCALYGLSCQEAGEEMALNWKTGELVPWDEAGLPEVDPPPASLSPDLTSQPIYSDPVGEYAFYTGSGGRTLWYVPTLGEPVLWVTEGENFVYLP